MTKLDKAARDALRQAIADVRSRHTTMAGSYFNTDEVEARLAAADRLDGVEA
jgi:hypothetical protein